MFWVSFSAKMSQVVKRDQERVQRVHSNIIDHQYAIEAEAKLRQKITVESSIEQMENEMREEIARSLKNSEGKVLYFIQRTNKGRDEAI